MARGKIADNALNVALTHGIDAIVGKGVDLRPDATVTIYTDKAGSIVAERIRCAADTQYTVLVIGGITYVECHGQARAHGWQRINASPAHRYSVHNLRYGQWHYSHGGTRYSDGWS